VRHYSTQLLSHFDCTCAVFVNSKVNRVDFVELKFGISEVTQVCGGPHDSDEHKTNTVICLPSVLSVLVCSNNMQTLPATPLTK
jgi:hypothetical protein